MDFLTKFRTYMPFFRKMAKKKENKIPPKIRPLVKPQNHLIVLPLIPIDAVSKKVLTLDEVSKFKKKDQEVYRQKKKEMHQQAGVEYHAVLDRNEPERANFTYIGSVLFKSRPMEFFSNQHNFLLLEQQRARVPF